MGEGTGGSLRAVPGSPMPPEPWDWPQIQTRPRLWLGPLTPEPAAALSPQEERWCAALPEALQGRYRGSRSQLRQRLAQLLARPAAELPLHSPPGQPPSLGEGLGFVSLSHSREQLLLAWSPWPIGVDLEWAARPLLAEAVARRFFPPEEWHDLQTLPPEQRQRAVLESWVRKEAAIKWHRGGIAHDLRHWSWHRLSGALVHLQHGWCPSSACRLHDGWLCAVVGEAAPLAIWG